MHDSRYRTYGISFVCGRNMVSADLHAYHNFIGLAGYHRAESGNGFGKRKSYAAVCLEGAIIVLACIIFSLFASSPPVVDPDAAAVTQVWSYVGELVFNMLVLVGAVKMADRVVREMMGL